MRKLTKDLQPAERKAMWRVFWRSYAMNASRTGATQYHGLGFLWTLMPMIDLLYKDQLEERKKANVRHTTWFNATLHFNDFIVGLVVSMEKKNAEDPEHFDASSITAIKASLMGPLSGIGDSFFWGFLRVVAAGIGISLASAGSPLGAIVFWLLYNIPAYIIPCYSLYGGYSVGTTFIERLYESGGMKILTKVSSLLGLMMGSMTAYNVKFKTIVAVTVQSSSQVMKIQTYLDQLFIGLVPLCVTLGAFYLIHNKHVNVNWVMLEIMILGIVLGLCGIC